MTQTREICKACWRPNPIGFLVPNKIWNAVVPELLLGGVICIMCFDMFATESGIDWVCPELELFPVSGMMHLHDLGWM